MANKSIFFWNLGEELAKGSWKTGQYISSPVIKKDGNTNWSLCFYPEGVSDTSDGLVFSLDRDVSEKETSVKLEFHLCHLTNPVKTYTIQHLFEENESSFRCQLNDMKNLARLRIFIPLSTLCVHAFLTVDAK